MYSGIPILTKKKTLGEFISAKFVDRLVDVSDIFCFLSARGGGRGSPRRWDRGGGWCTRAKWAPFVLLAFFPQFYSLLRFKIGHFPF